MAKEPKCVRLGSHTDLLAILEAVRTDKAPRPIERNGEALAVVVDPGEYTGTAESKSKRNKHALLAMAGIWSDLDADAMIEDVYRARRAAMPSPPISE